VTVDRVSHAEVRCGVGLMPTPVKNEGVTVDAGFVEPPRFDVGDRVIAVEGIGGWLRPRVPRHTHGVVIARKLSGEFEVHFDGGHTEVVGPELLAPG